MINYYSTKLLGYNPLAYYRLGEAVGATTATDASGNSNTGTISGGVTLGVPGLITGDRDTAYLFDGVTGVVTLPLLTTKTASILLSAWVTLPTASGHGAIIKIGDSTSGYTLGIGGTTQANAGVNLIGVLDGVAYVPTTVPLTVGVKHHVAMVIVGSTWYFYLDGDLCANLTQSIASAITPATHCYIGNDPAGSPTHLNATIDEVFIDDVTSSSLAQIAAQVADLYLQVPLELPPAPIGSPSGYLTLIGGKDRTPDTNINYAQITTALNDRMPQVQLSIDDSLCANPINIFDEVVIVDQHTSNPTHNFIIDPNLTHSPVYTTTNVQPTVPNSANGAWTLSNTDVNTTITTSPLTITVNNTGNAPNLVQWTQPNMVTGGVLYMFSAQCTVLSTLVNAEIIMQLDFYDSTAKTTIGFGFGGGGGGHLGGVSTIFTTTQRAAIQMLAPPTAAYVGVMFTVLDTVALSNSGSVAFTNLQLEPVWFPYLQSYPTPICAVGQNGCIVLPNMTTVRQNRVFAGIVSDCDPGNTSGDSEQSGYNGVSRTWDVHCKGPNWLLDSILVQATYTAQQDYQIINSIVSAQLANKLTINNVDVGVVLDQRAYDDQTLTDVLADMCNASGFIDYVDFYYDLHYIAIGTEQAVGGLSDNPDMVTTFPYSVWSCPRDGNNIQNSVIVKGGAFTGTYTDSYTASGTQKQFTLTQSGITAIDSVVVNGVLQTDGIDGNANYSFSNSQVLTNFPGHFIRFNANVPGGQIVTVVYKYNGTVRVVQTDLNSVARYKGQIITGRVNDTTATTTLAATQRALEYLNQNSTELISPHVKTLLPLYVGQVVNITNALESFSSKPFIVQTVTVTLQGNGLIEYDATCGSDVPTFIHMHHRIAKITQRSKSLPGVAFSNQGYSVSDSVSIGPDSISHTP